MSIEICGIQFTMTDLLIIVVLIVTFAQLVVIARYARINGRHIREQALFRRAQAEAHVAEEIFKGGRSDDVKLEYIESNMGSPPSDCDIATSALFEARKRRIGV